MLIIYFRSDGEIFQVVSGGYKNMEEFYGRRFEEFSLIFDFIYIENHNDYFFNRYIEFYVENKKIKTKEDNILNLLNM